MASWRCCPRAAAPPAHAVPAAMPGCAWGQGGPGPAGVPTLPLDMLEQPQAGEALARLRPRCLPVLPALPQPGRCQGCPATRVALGMALHWPSPCPLQSCRGGCGQWGHCQCWGRPQSWPQHQPRVHWGPPASPKTLSPISHRTTQQTHPPEPRSALTPLLVLVRLFGNSLWPNAGGLPLRRKGVPPGAGVLPPAATCLQFPYCD